MATRPAPSLSEVERAFADAMAAASFLPGRIEADTPAFVRFDAPGDKKGRQNGFYKLKTGDWPVGWFGDWKIGEQQEWSWHQSQGFELTDAERRKMKAEQRKLKIEAQVARETKQAEVAVAADAMWASASPEIGEHPYLARKDVVDPVGLRLHVAADGTRLIAVPMWLFDMNGKAQLTNLQLIDPQGKKRFRTGGRVEGTFFSIRGDASAIVLCEGVATAFSIWRATGLSTVAAFNSGNLIPVAKEFALARPLATILIAGDDDVLPPADWEARGKGRPWANAGALKAEAAAKAIGCRWILPRFAAGPARDRTDFNDLHLAEGLQAAGGQIMGTLRSVEPEEAELGAQLHSIDRAQDESWRSMLPRTSQGNPDSANVRGVALYIQNYEPLVGRLKYNAFKAQVEIDGLAMEDHHIALYRAIMHEDRFKAKKGDVMDEMLAEARRGTYDPLDAYLSSLKWDGVKRLDTWAVRYLGARNDNSGYTSGVGRKFMIGSVARALKPGCKLDTMLVLEGPQGSGKSTALRVLFGDSFFTDNLPDFHSKDSFLQLQGAWCIEVAELSALSKAEVKDVKQFLSRLVDKFRAPYAKLPIEVPRRTIFAGTVNPEDNGYLRDPTGNRRFWPIECGTIDLEGIRRDRDQLWAEAIVAYRAGERWHLTDDMVGLAEMEQEARREIDPWEEVIRLWSLGRGELTIAETLDGALKITPDRQMPAHTRRVGAAFRALGWSADHRRINGQRNRTTIFVSPGRSAPAGPAAPHPDANVQRDQYGWPIED